MQIHTPGWLKAGSIYIAI